jgi:glycine hydroxymethyltransferase
MIFSKNEEIAQKINKAVFPGLQGGPHMHTIASMAVALKEAQSPKYKRYLERVIKNCQALGLALKDLGFRLISDGSDNHLLLIDLRKLGISGKEAEERLDKVGIIVNKNTIPFDPNPPLNPSGIRLGTPAVTTRGMTEKEMRVIAQLIKEALFAKKERELALIKARVKKLATSFPLFKE